MSDVTQILGRIEAGDPSAAEQLLPLLYNELRRLAAQKIREEKPGQTLQATALVHEAYLRLVDVEKVACPPHDLPPVVELVDAVHALRALEALAVADRVVLSSSPDGTWTAMTSDSSGAGAYLSAAVRNLLSASLPRAAGG